MGKLGTAGFGSMESLGYNYGDMKTGFAGIVKFQI